MESLVALGFAGNVVTFVDFTIKVISQTTRIHRTKAQSQDPLFATDLDHIQRELKNVTRLIKLPNSTTEALGGKIPFANLSSGDKTLRKTSWTKHIQLQQLRDQNLASSGLSDDDFEDIEQLRPAKLAQLSACDRDIFRICVSCQEIANELRATLMALKSSKSTVWASFYEAIRTVWSQEEIQSLENSLSGYRQQMTVLLLGSLREKVEGLRRAQSSDSKDIYENTKRIRNQLEILLDAQERWKGEVIRAVQQDYRQQHNICETTTPSGGSLYKDLNLVRKREFHNALLRWIRFMELDLRSEKIASAHAQTFEWIFHPPPGDRWSDFSMWLESESEHLYWITGKPAAGKSTLMKFIHNDPRTKEQLTRWAGGSKLITCVFYFWNSGTPMQMSEEAMMRTFLHMALRQAPELFSIIFPSKLEEYILFADPWRDTITFEEVKRAFKLLIDTAGDGYKLFFFIDGLDEFGGSHEGLVTMIQGLLSPHVKTCVSSRAWSIFEDGFLQRPSLRLEDLTYDDIKHYITSRFSSSIAFQERRLETPKEADRLIETLTSKASGVFLWVQLVTESLLQGLTAGESLKELDERLNAIPVDLEELFYKLLSGVEGSNRVHTSQILQIMRESDGSMMLLYFSYADDADQEVISKAPFGTPESEQMKMRAQRMRRRIKACCKGLIEADPVQDEPPQTAKVAYLHRTVKDYLQRDKIWLQFIAMKDDDFNLPLRMFNALAIRLKLEAVRFFADPESGLNSLWQLVLSAIQYAVRAYPGKEHFKQFDLLSELDTILSRAASVAIQNGNNQLQHHGSNSYLSKHWSATRKRGQFNSSFMQLAIQLQLTDYVRAFQSQQRLLPAIPLNEPSDATRNLLLATMHYDNFVNDTGATELDIIPSSPCADLVALFLNAGADPNFKIENALASHGNITGAYTSWETHLREPNRDTQVWKDISALYLKHGADPKPVLDSAAHLPPTVVALARTKEKEMQRARKRQRVKRFGSIFKVRKTQGLGSVKVAVA